MNRVVFEFRDANPDAHTEEEKYPHLHCHRIGQFTSRGLELVARAAIQQWKDQLKTDGMVIDLTAEESTSANAQGGITALAEMENLDRYDPERYRAA